MRAPTVLISAAIHVAIAVSLITGAQNRENKRRAISVAVTEEKKKVAAKPKPPPPPPPPVRRAAPRVVASLPKAEAPTPVRAAAAPMAVATNLTMSNDDVGPGIALGGGRAPAEAAPKRGPAAVKVASAISEQRTRHTQQELSGGGDQPCNEEPTKPVPEVMTEINYSIYPQAQQEGIEGKFRARIIVGANGEVTEIEVLIGIEPGFDAAIKAALMRWRFKPAMLCGKPIAGGSHPFTARFELAD